ncbi:hypothetical protein [Aeromonas dhakensis]
MARSIQKITGSVTIALSALIGSVSFPAESANDMLTFPVLQLGHVNAGSTCSNWKAQMTFTAVPFSAASLKAITGKKYWMSVDKLYWEWGGVGQAYWGLIADNLQVELRGATPEERVAEVNQAVFGDSHPTAGTTITLRNQVGKLGGAGSCYSPPNFECAGMVMGDDPFLWGQKTTGTAELDTFPPGSQCSRPNLSGGSCSFDVASLTIDMGLMGPDGSSKTAQITATCSGGANPGYEVALMGGGSSVAAEGVSIALDVDGNKMPFTVKWSDGAQKLTLHAKATPVAGATGNFSASGTIYLRVM